MAKAPTAPKAAPSARAGNLSGAQSSKGGGPLPTDLPDDPRTINYDPAIIGSTGLRQYGGFVVEEFVKELKGLRGMQTYREMSDNDSVCGAILFAIEMLIRQTSMSVQAADESDEAAKGKEFLEQVFEDMSCSFADVLSEICTQFTYGYAPMEIVWKKRGGLDTTDPTCRSQYTDGKIGIRNISLRSQTTVVRWVFDEEDGGILGMVQQPYSGTMVTIPITKMLLFRTRNERNNPEGRSVLRTAYRSWFFKKRIEEVEGIGIERDLAGLPVARIPGSYLDQNADDAQKGIAAAWKKLVQNVRRDAQEGLVLPSDKKDGAFLFDFQLLNSGGSRAVNTSEIINRYDTRITASVLADFIMLGQRSSGSHALSKDKTEIFNTAIGAFLDGICDTFNRHMVSRLWKLNGLDAKTQPKLTHGDIERKDLAGLAALLTALAGAGATLFPDADLENHIREEAGLPPAPEDGEGWGAQPAQPPGAGGMPAMPGTPGALAAARANPAGAAAQAAGAPAKPAPVAKPAPKGAGQAAAKQAKRIEQEAA